MITLKRPTKEYEEQAIAFKNDFFDNGELTINGSELLDQMDSYDEWLKSVTDNMSPETVNPSWVVTDTYFAFDDNDKIVGTFRKKEGLCNRNASPYHAEGG